MGRNGKGQQRPPGPQPGCRRWPTLHTALLLSRAPGTLAAASNPMLMCPRAAQPGRERGHSRVLWESHPDHAGPPCDRSRGSLAVSSPRITQEHNVLLNELQF